MYVYLKNIFIFNYVLRLLLASYMQYALSAVVNMYSVMIKT